MRLRLLMILALTLTIGAAPVLAGTAPKAAIKKDISMQSEVHSAFTALLRKYVHPGEDGVNRVDYTAWQENAADMGALEAYIADCEEMDFAHMTQDEAIASWSNLYNAVTLRYILDRYPVKSIKSGYFGGPWKKVKVTADGRRISLHQIEHEILRPMGDARIHYAINCASYSCPNLQPHAWEAATLDADLDKAAAEYINNPRGVKVKRNGLAVSSIYNWYEGDFGGDDASVIAHLLRYASPELAANINAHPKIRKYGYDWSLNDAEESK